MKGSSERVLECTTGQFDGAIAMISPEQSWVVRASLSLVAFVIHYNTKHESSCIVLLGNLSL